MTTAYWSLARHEDYLAAREKRALTLHKGYRNFVDTTVKRLRKAAGIVTIFTAR